MFITRILQYELSVTTGIRRLRRCLLSFMIIVAVVGFDQQQCTHNLRYRVQRNFQLMSIDLRNERAFSLDLAGHSLNLADLRGARMEECCLDRTDLRQANLQQAHFFRCDFQRANLDGANLTGARLQNCNLSNACLVACDLSGADLTGAQLYGTDLGGTILDGAILAGALYDDRTRWPKWPVRVDPKALGARYDPDGSPFETHRRLRYGPFVWKLW